MTDAQLTALWAEITRTARPGARVIFRTAAEPRSCRAGSHAGVLSAGPMRTRSERAPFTRQDRSSIYGGFHLYVLQRMSAVPPKSAILPSA